MSSEKTPLTKIELAAHVAKRFPALNEGLVYNITDAVLDELTKQMQDGGDLRFRGKFSVRVVERKVPIGLGSTITKTKRIYKTEVSTK